MSVPHTTPHRTDAKRGKRVRVAPGIFGWENLEDRFLIFWSVDGKESSKSFRGSLAQAVRERERLRVKSRDGEVVANTRLTLAQVASEYFAMLDGKVATGERAPRTVELYRGYFANHIKDELGRLRVQQITVGHIDRFIAALRNKPRSRKKGADLLSAWAVHNIVGMLSKLFRYAHKRGYVAVNPIERIRDELPAGRNKQTARVLEARFDS
jgi:hypothetical protein